MKSTKTPTSRNLGMLIAKNIIVMLVLVAVVLFSSFSWFTQKTEAIADGISMEAKAPDGLEIAIVAHGAEAPSDSDYVEGTISLNAENCEFLKELYFSEITGSGLNDQFYKPMLTQANGKATPDVKSEWDKAEANKHYISFDLYMRSKGVQTVYVQESTSVKPVSEKLKWADGVDGSSYNPTTSGNFSRDCVVGATRLSIVDAKNTSKLLWIPAPNLRLSDDAKTVSDGLLLGDSYVHKYYVVNEPNKTLTSATNVITNNKGDYTLGQKIQIAELDTKVNNNDEYFVNHVTCHFWIEGEDAEARLALTGGKFRLNLQLTINK